MIGSTEPEDEHHDPQEAVQAFGTMSERERANMMKAAQFLAGRGNLADADELLSEAYIRVSNGKRKWPRGQTFVSFLGGILKSLATDKMFATDAKKIRSLSVPFSVVADEGVPDIAHDDDNDTASSKQLQQELVGRLEAHFQDDDEMQLLIMGIMERLRGQALAEFVDVDAKRLEALRTRFNRAVDKIGAEIKVREGMPS